MKNDNLLRWLATVLWLSGLVLSPDASASSPSLTLAQMVHTSWGSREGIGGRVNSIAQTDDGFLWLATTAGLLRFDGTTFKRMERLGGEKLDSTSVTSVRVINGVGLLLAFGNGGVGIYQDGHFSTLGTNGETGYYSELLKDQDGRIWTVQEGSLQFFDGRKFVSPPAEWRVPQAVVRMTLDSHGTLWTTSAPPAGLALHFLPRGARSFLKYDQRLPTESVDVTADGNVWVSGHDGAATIAMENGLPGKARMVTRQLTGPVLEDRDGAMWFGHEGQLSRIRDIRRKLKAIG
ncbi:MAG: Two component regulator, sensor protein, partial [Rhizobacter sp.]|nr:Two component regulator, sensor protein [Rhizobacter sp.]